MNMDGATLYRVVLELRRELTGGRIDKLTQPVRDEIHILIRSDGGNKKLLLSSNPNNCRVHLTAAQKENPLQAPAFCMLLRRRLISGRITAIEQPMMDRIIEVSVLARDELGEPAEYKLILEMMGKHSNIIFTSGSGTILDSIKRVPEHISRVRQVLPGLMYEPPPDKGKHSPLTLSLNSLEDIMSGVEDVPVDKYLLKKLNGLSGISAGEICEGALYGARGTMAELSAPKRRALAAVTAAFIKELGDEAIPSVLVFRDGIPSMYLPFRYQSVTGDSTREYTSPSEMLDSYYIKRDEAERFASKASSLLKTVRQNLEKTLKALAVHQEALTKSSKMEKYKLFAELISANAWNLKKGMDKAVVQDYTDEALPEIEIPLDKMYTPIQNSQRYYKRYAKLRAARDYAKNNLNDIQAEVDYLESLEDNIEKCTELNELTEIREEMARGGYIKPDAKAKKKPKQEVSSPMSVMSGDGVEILVGKNNRQNDYLTFRLANAMDTWLHTKDIAGSHVIIRSGGKEVPDGTLEEASALAAKNSKARGSSKVPVDYTLVKHVRKPPGAKPGMVIYDSQKTIIVD